MKSRKTTIHTDSGGGTVPAAGGSPSQEEVQRRLIQEKVSGDEGGKHAPTP